MTGISSTARALASRHVLRADEPVSHQVVLLSRFSPRRERGDPHDSRDQPPPDAVCQIAEDESRGSRRVKDVYGIEHNEIPSWTLESEPGDLIIWNFRTLHASFNGGERRRLFSINFREADHDTRD